MTKKVKLVEITWLDAEGPENGGGWAVDVMDEETNFLKTYGLLCREPHESNWWIHFADTYDPTSDEPWGKKERIPKGMVMSIRDIEVIEYDT